MSKRDFTLYIIDTFIAIDRIQYYTREIHNSDSLQRDEIVWDATRREYKNHPRIVILLLCYFK